MGLSGLGDLVLTCGSEQSRNFALGLALGRGETPAGAAHGKLAEGAATAPVLVEMAREKGVEMPIAASVEALLAGRISIDRAIEALAASIKLARAGLREPAPRVERLGPWEADVARDEQFQAEQDGAAQALAIRRVAVKPARRVGDERTDRCNEDASDNDENADGIDRHADLLNGGLEFSMPTG